MGRQPDNPRVRKINREVEMEGDAPYHRIMQPGTDPDKQVKLGAAGCHVLGVTIIDPNYQRSTPDGISKRLGFYDGEYPDIAVEEVVPIEYGATITARQKVICGEDGKAFPLTAPSGANQLADLQAMLLTGQIVGEAVESGDAGDVKLVDLSKKI